MKKISLGLLAVLFCISCTDLEPTLYSDLTTANAYNSESDIQAALVGVYADLSPYGYLNYNGYIVVTTDYTTDMGFSTAAGDPTKMSNFTYDSNNRYMKYNWRFSYQVISNANMLISKIDEVEMDESTRKEVIGQAKFLRALCYRDMTDAFGPVPLVTEPIDPMNASDMELSSIDDVDAVIIADCEYAIENLPESWSVDISRATKGAAAALLGKVYMRRKEYSKADEYISMVLDMRDSGVYTLNPDFKDVWSGSNKKDMGNIFAIMNEASQNGALLAAHFGPSDHPEVTDKWQYYAVSLEFWRKYHDDDPRKQFFYYDYYGAAPIEDGSDESFFYEMPEPGQTEPSTTTSKLLLNVSTKKYSYEMPTMSYDDGMTVSVFRLSDMILCKAEIENNLNGPAAALPYLNEVRSRAGAPEYGGEHVDFSAPTTTDEMDDIILAERGFELVFEFKRRPDLIRYGKYEEICNEYLESRGMAPSVTSNMTYLPYPLVEAMQNSNMASANVDRLP